MDCLTQGTSSFAVYDAHAGRVGQVGVVEIFVKFGQRFIHSSSEQIDLCGERGSFGHADASAGAFRTACTAIAFFVRCIAGQCIFIDEHKVFDIHFRADNAALYKEIALCVRLGGDRAL